MRHVVVLDASCLIDLRKGGLLPVLASLPYQLVVGTATIHVGDRLSVG